MSFLASRRLFGLFHPSRFFASVVKLPSVTSFEEFESYRTQEPRGVKLIDVRNPAELVDPGPIPGAVNVPLGEVTSAFGLSEEDFLQKYGVAKPTSGEPLVFFCLKGIRSQTAMEAVSSLGYSNVSNYVGSYAEWAERSTKR